jgi:Tol biopolymer transport system component/serine/threonine protein kinase
MEFHTGQRIGDYILAAPIGQGGFGAVWRARHIDGSRNVALKLLVGGSVEGKSAEMRAEIEVLAGAAAARSEHVVKVLGGGIEPVPYIVMEYVEGRDLASLLSQGRVSFVQAIQVGIGVADALRALSDAGIIHRDIKPANVMIDDEGVVKLADFGIAKIVGYETMTMVGQTAMTMAYAAPEIWDDSGRFGPIGLKVDLYALGVVLYQCLVGSPPFIGNFGNLYRLHTEQAPNLDALPADTPSSLRLLIRRCLEKRQEDRPRDAAECLAMLRRAEAELSESSPAKEPARFGPWIKDAPHEQQIWAWHCHHESRGDLATVEVHFSDDVAYASVLRKAVNASNRLVPYGAERLIETNRLLLHPDESWWDPPTGRFQFWVAREDLPLAPAALVTVEMLRSAVKALAGLIDAASSEGVPLDLSGSNLTLLFDGNIYVRRPGLSPAKADAAKEALTYLRGLELMPAAQSLLAMAPNFLTLVSLAANQSAMAEEGTSEATQVVSLPSADATLIVQRPAEASGITNQPAPAPASTVEPPPAAPARPIHDVPPRPRSASTRPPRRPRWLYFGSVGAITAAGVLAAILAFSGNDEKGRDPQGFVQTTPGTPARATATGGGVIPSGDLVDGLLFFTDRDTHEEIYVMNADGSNQKRLTNGLKANRQPWASGDGSKIVFVSARDNDGSELYVMNGDGSGQTRIPTVEGIKLEPNITMDGKRIVFEVLRGDNFDLYTVDIDGKNLVNLTNSPSADIDPVWSPDGKRIVFGSNRAGNMDIYTMNADGTNPQRLTNSPGFNGEPGWSPDGKKIVFESDRRGNFDIYTMNDDGTNVVRLGDDPGNEFDPAWSPDGRLIAYTSSRGGANEVFVSNVDGSGIRNLSNNPASDGKPAWTKLKRTP